MEYKEYAAIATIIRGLFINTAGYPWVVVHERCERAEETVSADALVVDISPALRDGVLDEEAAAKVFQEACTAWEFDKAPSGVEAAMKQEAAKKEPSCIVLKRGTENAVGAIEAFYWIDKDIDAARKRMYGKTASMLEGKAPQSHPLSAEPKLDAATRAGVVQHKIALLEGDAQNSASIARSLAYSGALVFIADANLETAQQLANAINTSARRTAAIPVQVNHTDEASVEALFNTIAETAGGLDICICAENMLERGNLLERSLEEFKTRNTAFFLIAKYAGLLFRRQFRTAPSWITDIIRISEYFYGENQECLGLAVSLALELIEYNIKVNTICPSNNFDHPFWTDPETGLFAQHLKAGKVPSARSIAEVKAYYEAKIPMKRSCTALDVMRAVYYVIEQNYETGQTLSVSGGKKVL
ncbi:MAG: SDR family oxidoreductase [Treponema sp.]|jgi:sorbitol-6-phosphate 2-dehydrogenase|nr:SDR family oxidoreductase [Treponema sp.]